MIILSHTTALHLLRHLGAETVSRLPRITLANLHLDHQSVECARNTYFEFAKSAGIPPASLHLLVPYGHPTWKDPSIVTHFSSDTRPAILIKISDEIYAPSPEYLIRQLSPLGSTTDLAQLIFELCGVYSHPTNQHLELKDRSSFTTKKSLQRYLDKHRPFRGAARFERALKLAKDRSASHMETACAILLGFPYRLGGLNFPEFEMNQRIDVPSYFKNKLKRSRCYGDLCWQKQRVILEYESNAIHVGAEKIAADSDRRNALLKTRYCVITLTGNQMYSYEEFLRTAHILAGKLGHRIQPRCKDYRKRHRALRWAVLNDQASVYQDGR